jgi:hypothetical protein
MGVTNEGNHLIRPSSSLPTTMPSVWTKWTTERNARGVTGGIANVQAGTRKGEAYRTALFSVVLR